MKIDELNQNATAAFLVGGRTGKSEPAEAHGEAVAKQHGGADKVDLSSYMPVVKDRLDVRVSRVQEVRAQIASGSYQVPGRAVAEKMLSKLVMSSAI